MLFGKFTILNVNFSSNLNEDTDLLGRKFLLFIRYKNYLVSLYKFRLLKHNHIKKFNWISSMN